MEDNSLPELREKSLKQLFNVEYYPMITEGELSEKKHTKASVGSISSLVSAFSALNQKGVYKAVFPNGVQGALAVAKDGSGNLGAIINETGVAGQARFIEVAMNPSQLFMAAAMMSIDQKLNDIQEIQQEIFNFLNQDKESKIIGDLSSLADIYNFYKFNWDSENYKNLKLNLVQDIKRDSKNNIIFYEKQIKNTIEKGKQIYTNRHIKDTLNDLQTQFRYYRLSNYMYSFASFLEVMLLGNFGGLYLESILKDLKNHSFRYRKVYTKCYDILERKTKSSIESLFLNFSADADKFARETISNNELLRKTRADKLLLKSSDSLQKHNSEIADLTMNQFKNNRTDGSSIFINNIDAVKKLYNEPLELYFDANGVYLNN